MSKQMLKESVVLLRDLRLYAYHGVMEQERRVGGWFSVSLRVKYHVGRALQTDSVGDTVNYAVLSDIVKREMAVPSALLEHVAGRVANAVFACYPQAIAVGVRLLKLNPPMGVDCGGAGVEIEIVNES